MFGEDPRVGEMAIELSKTVEDEFDRGEVTTVKLSLFTSALAFLPLKTGLISMLVRLSI